eukprot:635397-Amphidinium_carterae.1
MRGYGVEASGGLVFVWWVLGMVCPLHARLQKFFLGDAYYLSGGRKVKTIAKPYHLKGTF